MLVRYCAAALLVILAIVIGLRLSLGVETAFVLCFGGIVLSALYAGLAPAALALLLSAAALKFFFLQPHYELLPSRAGLDDTIRLGVFVMIGLITSCFAAGCRRTIHTLRISEDWHQFVAGTAADAIIGTSSNEKILFVNVAAERLLGYSAEEIVGQKLSRIIARDPWRPEINEITRCLQRCSPVSKPCTINSDCGHALQFELTINVFRNGKGIVFAFRDVTRDREHASIRPKLESIGCPDVNLTVCRCDPPKTETSYTALTAAGFSAGR